MMNMLKNNKIAVIFLSFILIIINILKMRKLTVMSLWHDESFSALLVQYNLNEMIKRIILDVHPPLYYLMLRAWSFIFTNSLFSIRMFSVLFGALSVIALYFFAERAFKNRKLAFITSTLLALSSFQIQYDIEARMYTLGAFFLIISSYFLIRALEEKKWLWWILYSLSAVASIYTHYYAIFWILAQAIFFTGLIIKQSGINPLKWLKNKTFLMGKVSYLLSVILFLPWIGPFLSQLKQVSDAYWIPPMNIWSIPNTFLSMTIGTSTDPSQFPHFLIAIMIFVLCAVIFFFKSQMNQEKWFIFLLLILPFLFSFLLSLKTSIYLDRYFIFALPFYIVFLSVVFFSIKKKHIKNGVIVLAILGTAISFPTRWSFFKIEKRPGMAAAAQLINKEVEVGDKIFVGSSFVFFTFKYYNQTQIKPLLYAPDTLYHFSGTAILDEEEIISDFHEAVEKNDVVWIINTTGFGDHQPTVPINWIKIKENGFEDIYDYRGWIMVTKYLID